MAPQSDKTKALFLAAMDLATDAERTTFLDEACPQDKVLRERVDALVKAHHRTDPLLDRTAAEHLELPATGSPELDDNSLSFLDPPTRKDSLGRLGHYEVLQLVGRGSMGLVLRSYDEKLQRVVAIKALALPLAASGSARQRFTREGRAAAAVTHDNVIAIYAVEDAGPVPYLVMQFIEGVTLQEKIARTGPLQLMETLRIGLQIAEGLSAAHRQGLVHRDVKPANILLENGVERVKLTDFGLARAADDASLTREGVLAGTPMYMSPEQAQGEPVDARSDLFSLGSVLYTMCTGRPPFRAPSAIAVLKRVCEETPQSIRAINPELPQWLEDFLSRMLAKAPHDRIATAREVADFLTQRLSELQQGRPSAVLPAQEKKSPSRARWAIVAAVLMLGLGSLGFAEATGTTNVRSTIVRLFSKEGTLVVEVDDPDVSIQIDGSELVITGAGVKEIRLKPGSYTVEARKDGKIVSRELVSVTKNGRQVVRISQEAVAAVHPKAPSADNAGSSPKARTDATDWESAVASEPAGQQVKRVLARLQELNKNYDGKVTPTIEKDVVTGLEFHTNELSNLSPLHALKGLQTLICEGLDGKGKLTDLDPLEGLKLKSLNCSGNPISNLSPLRGMPLTVLRFRNGNSIDLAPLKGMKLTELECGLSGVTDLSPLKGMKLTRLQIDHSPVKDLSPLEGMPLKYLHFGGSLSITDLSPLKGMPLTHLFCNDTLVTDLSPLRGMLLKEIACDFKAERGDTEILRSIKSLEAINSKSAAKFWSERIQALIGFAPLSDAEIKRIASLPVAEQLEEVRKELKRRNPDFNGTLTPTIENGAVTRLSFSTMQVSDIEPVRALSKLNYLDCSISGLATGRLTDLSPLRGLPLTFLAVENNPVFDLSPLKGLKLKSLKLGVTKVSDLSPLQGMPLEVLHCGFTRVADLSPLKGMKLIEADFQATAVSDLRPLEGMPIRALECYGLRQLTDLSPLKGMRLTNLNIHNTGVADLSPLKGMPIERLNIPGTKVTDLAPLSDMKTLKWVSLGKLDRFKDLSFLKGLPLVGLRVESFRADRDANVLRSISSLKTINDQPVADFWQEVDAKNKN